MFSIFKKNNKKEEPGINKHNFEMDLIACVLRTRLQELMEIFLMMN